MEEENKQQQKQQSTAARATSEIPISEPGQTPVIAQHLGFKSSELPQQPELQKYLTQQLTGDPYNKFCVDCQRA